GVWLGRARKPRLHAYQCLLPRRRGHPHLPGHRGGRPAERKPAVRCQRRGGRMRQERGFTLIEVLVASTISLIVLSAAMGALGTFGHAADLRTRQNDVSDRARGALARIAKELRGVQAGRTA